MSTEPEFLNLLRSPGIYPSLAGRYATLFDIPEPVFVNLLRSLGIDSQPSGAVPPRRVPQPYLSYRPGRLQRLAESISRNRFLRPINVYKYGLNPLGYST